LLLWKIFFTVFSIASLQLLLEFIVFNRFDWVHWFFVVKIILILIPVIWQISVLMEQLGDWSAWKRLTI
jgi:hypothetical protein